MTDTNIIERAVTAMAKTGNRLATLQKKLGTTAAAELDSILADLDTETLSILDGIESGDTVKIGGTA